ncbi:hypothetical protein [uncultured Thermomonospora sp.]|uniref:hypothetical protein n=1 Tax=uncultured Thermomonospora sp. TaxID=671175 RepID=UPI00259B4CFD|nr:hypothetical protein [uncultured Thermomonospora sp.]
MSEDTPPPHAEQNPQEASDARAFPTPTGSSASYGFAEIVSTVGPYVVDVAAYLGAAALGGIVGNRADAGTVAAVRRMFQAVRDRWRERSTDPAAPLTREEAIEAATAAVLSQSLSFPSSDDLRAIQQPDGSWRIVFHEDSRPALTVTVPAGDPGSAMIVVVVNSAAELGSGPYTDVLAAQSPTLPDREAPGHRSSIRDAIKNWLRRLRSRPRGR